MHEQVFVVVFRVNVARHSVTFPVISAHETALVGHFVQLLLPGLNYEASQTVIATHSDPDNTGVLPLHPHLPVEGEFSVKVD